MIFCVLSGFSHRNFFQKLPLQCRHFLENPLAKNPQNAAADMWAINIANRRIEGIPANRSSVLKIRVFQRINLRESIRKILAPIKIESALPPPPKTQNTPPPKNEEFYGHGFSCRKNAFFQASIKLTHPFPAPELQTEILRPRGFFLNQFRFALRNAGSCCLPCPPKITCCTVFFGLKSHPRNLRGIVAKAHSV